MPTVQIIKATKSHNSIIENRARKLKVAAYARVSTEKDEQENSYENQIRYFTNLIQSNPNYVFVDMYADEGLTGTMLKKRDSFNRMIEDALAGKIDIIYVKSVSRFARNTVDLLCICRELKSKNVNVIFEKENLELMSTSGELMLTIFASLAQEESRSISENIKWTVQKNFEKGIYHMPYSNFLGYEKGPDGKPKIVESEAALVRKIYKLFLYGYPITAIAAELTREGIPTPRGCEVWVKSTVKSILTNEKYCGDARLQKQYTADFLNHKRVKNEGQVASYYVTDDHEGIVSHEIFDLVQEIINAPASQRNSGDMFSRKLYCSCGKLYGRKVHHSNDKYRTCIYRCNHEYDDDHPFKSARLKEQQIKDSFTKAVNCILDNQSLIEDILLVAGLYEDNSECESELQITNDKLRIIEEETRTLVEQSSKSSDIETYRKRYDALLDEYEKLRKKAIDLQQHIESRKAKHERILRYARTLQAVSSPVMEFDEDLWFSLLEKAIVNKASITYVFRDGTKQEINI